MCADSSVRNLLLQRLHKRMDQMKSKRKVEPGSDGADGAVQPSASKKQKRDDKAADKQQKIKAKREKAKADAAAEAAQANGSGDADGSGSGDDDDGAASGSGAPRLAVA